MRKIAGFIAISSLFTAFAAPAAASDRSASGMQISLVVPEVCEIRAPTLAVNESDGVATGSIFEMCNSGRAFRIVASHRVLAENEEIEITYAGETRQLEESGASHVADRSGPSARAVPITVRPNRLNGSLAISLGIIAI